MLFGSLKVKNKDFENYIKSIDVTKSFLQKRNNGILLSDEEVQILENYKIPYQNCTSTDELIFKIEEYLNDEVVDADDLENLSSRLSEFKYYYETRK